MFREIILPIFRSTRLCVTACDIMHPRCCRPVTGIINKPLLLHLVGCLYYLYQGCTVKQISDNEIYLLIKYIKRVLWRVAKCLSYIEEARCLKVNPGQRNFRCYQNHGASQYLEVFLHKSNCLNPSNCVKIVVMFFRILTVLIVCFFFYVTLTMSF